MVILIDTNILIDHLRLLGHNSRYTNLITKYINYPFAISPITIHELFVGQSTKSKNSTAFLSETLSELDILHYTPDVAQLAGQITRDLPRTIQFADAAIAATSLHYQAKLATLNTKDFAGIPALQLLKL